jgi:flavin reductase (DIM6/NTAB) family NADH-FMN oxidoreductase RutF
MALNPEALWELYPCVHVVTSKSNEKINGLTIAWATRVSNKPPLVGVAVDKRWYSHELLEKGTHFVINVLADDQINLARHFGSVSGRTTDKFKNVDYELNDSGVPVLPGCKAWIECTKINQFSTGDHSIFIGAVDRARMDESKTRLIYDRKALSG